MKKNMVRWIIPLLIAVFLIAIIRVFVLQIVSIDGKNMESTFRVGEKTVFSKLFKPETNAIVLVQGYPLNNEIQIHRIIALPGDIITIENSVVFVNKKQHKDPGGVSYAFCFKSDSIEYAVRFLDKYKIEYNRKLAEIGVFKINADSTAIDRIKNQKYFSKLELITDEIMINNGPVIAVDKDIYWNKDHLGPVKVPAKGQTIKMNKASFYFYKSQIKYETGKTLEMEQNQFTLDGAPIDSYTFKENYYFLMNDRRSDSYDSRRFGFVPQKAIISAFWFKLPW